ncbi:MAG: uroporphyrinogen decarboxylase [Verrucomicrobia bacterium]|nr:MAG: uroporphyrinogen decarboxylase [Verrucomicrobiota bacterium]
MKPRERFLAACRCQPVDHPPVWLMRQAGRCLPEYRALKERHSFLELVRTPELAVEVTLQPVRRFGFDAAILFSDILITAEALGQAYRFREGGGIEMAFAVRSEAEIDRLELDGFTERLAYVWEALRRLRRELDGERALIGFAGSPWTLANFMIEGGSAREWTRARAMVREQPGLYGRLAEKLTEAVIRLLEAQIEAGAEVVQVFDTLGGVAGDDFEAASGRWLKEIVQALRNKAPVILFAKGVRDRWEELAATGAAVLGVDHETRMEEVLRRIPPSIAVQGNLPPELLLATPEAVRRGVREVLQAVGGRPGHIFNLGHGVPPEAKLENIAALVEAVRTGA